ncbi:MAG: EfeM/EfeO family lipoprotein, partial [Ilumatobacteraceae bacterium]
MRTRRTVAALTLAALLAVTAGCGDDDGADVRDLGDGTGASASGSGSGSGSGSASASGSGSGSATGIAAGTVAQSTDNPLITEAVDGYRAYVDEQVAIMLAATTVFTDAVRAGDIEAAKAAFPVSRRSWERIEPIAGLIENIDTAVDAREDDYDGPTDDEFTGWHRLEYQLWDAA